MADSFIQLPADSTGKQLDTVIVNMGVGTTQVHREKVVISDPASTTGFATVTTSAGLLASLSSGTVTLSSAHIVSLSSGTVTLSSQPGPWSSAPGFNVPVVSVSSGLVQISGTANVLSASSGFVQAYQAGTWTVQTTAGTAINTSSAIGLPVFYAITPTSSVAGAAIAPVTSSQGLQVSSTQAQTITGTVTVLSASSGLVQISGTPAVTSTFVLATPASTAGVVGPVTSSAGVLASLSSGTVTISGTVTVLSASSGLVQISGIPTVLVASSAGLTQTVTVLSASSGLVQAYQVGTWTVQTSAGTAINTSSAIGLPVFHAITATSSVAGASIAPVTSSAGLLANLSSGTVTLSSLHSFISTSILSTSVILSSAGLTQISGTVTVLSASSGLVQISGTPAVTSTFVLATPASTAGVVGVVTSSGGQTVSISVNTAAGFGPVTSSFGQLINQTTASIPSVINATSANPTPVYITSSVAIAPVTLIASTVSKVSSSAGALYSLWAFTTVPAGAVLRLYNATTSNVSMGASVLGYFLTGAQSTLTDMEENILYPGPRSLNFGTACSFDVVLNATSTAAVAGNTFVTWQFV